MKNNTVCPSKNDNISSDEIWYIHDNSIEDPESPNFLFEREVQEIQKMEELVEEQRTKRKTKKIICSLAIVCPIILVMVVIRITFF